MSGDDFDEIFGGKPKPRPTFAERVGQSPPRVDRSDPIAGMAAEAATEKPTSDLYKPFGFMPAGVGECCDVQRWIDGTATPEGIEFQYRFLMQIGYVGDEQLKLFLPDCIVVIDGVHLRELRKKLARRQVTFIQQFSPLVWSRSNVEGAIIRSIAVIRPDQN